MYMTTTLNHQAVRTWADMHDGQVLLEAGITLEAKICHDMMGAVPSHPVTWKLASDKVAFKLRLLQAGLPTPKMWTAPENATEDYVVKHSMGAVGHDLTGPFKAGTVPDKAAFKRLLESKDQGSTYVEAFVAGTSMKVWFWGEQAFFVQKSCSAEAGKENTLSQMTAEQRSQIERIGQALALDLQHEFGAPVLYSLDAVLDEEGRIWWLEMHSEPVLPAADYLAVICSAAELALATKFANWIAFDKAVCAANASPTCPIPINAPNAGIITS